MRWRCCRSARGASRLRASEASAGWSFAAAEVGRLGAAEQPEVVRRLGALALERLREQYARLADLLQRRPARGEPARPRRARRRGARWWRWSAEPGETAYLETVLFFSRFSAAEIEELFGDLRRLEAPRGADGGRRRASGRRRF